ncbi:YcgJ family protein [Photobacterium alginatilyticum]|uniref:YcgJ family protein n=1 Tax=Photobacterium alginatilyticum TaxID=1775171 RepID=UPI0040686452
MTMKLLATATLICVAYSSHASTRLDEHVFSPDHGIICDQRAGFCVDRYGISMAFTKEFLGQAAQDKMMKMINEVGAKNFDTSRYSFSNKVYCDSGQQACFTDRYQEQPQENYSQVLFN